MAAATTITESDVDDGIRSKPSPRSSFKSNSSNSTNSSSILGPLMKLRNVKIRMPSMVRRSMGSNNSSSSSGNGVHGHQHHSIKRGSATGSVSSIIGSSSPISSNDALVGDVLGNSVSDEIVEDHHRMSPTVDKMKLMGGDTSVDTRRLPSRNISFRRESSNSPLASTQYRSEENDSDDSNSKHSYPSRNFLARLGIDKRSRWTSAPQLDISASSELSKTTLPAEVQTITITLTKNAAGVSGMKLHCIPDTLGLSQTTSPSPNNTTTAPKRDLIGSMRDLASAAGLFSGRGSLSPRSQEYIPQLIYVSRVWAGSAAEDAGVQAGDVINQVNSVHPQSIREAMGLFDQARDVQLVLFRPSKDQAAILLAASYNRMQSFDSSEIFGCSFYHRNSTNGRGSDVYRPEKASRDVSPSERNDRITDIGLNRKYERGSNGGIAPHGRRSSGSSKRMKYFDSSQFSRSRGHSDNSGEKNIQGSNNNSVKAKLRRNRSNSNNCLISSCNEDGFKWRRSRSFSSTGLSEMASSLILAENKNVYSPSCSALPELDRTGRLWSSDTLSPYCSSLNLDVASTGISGPDIIPIHSMGTPPSSLMTMLSTIPLVPPPPPPPSLAYPAPSHLQNRCFCPEGRCICGAFTLMEPIACESGCLGRCDCRLSSSCECRGTCRCQALSCGCVRTCTCHLTSSDTSAVMRSAPWRRFGDRKCSVKSG